MLSKPGKSHDARQTACGQSPVWHGLASTVAPYNTSVPYLDVARGVWFGDDGSLAIDSNRAEHELQRIK